MNINQHDQKTDNDTIHQRMIFLNTTLMCSNISYINKISNTLNDVKLDQLPKSFLAQLNKKLTKQKKTQELKFINSKMNINRRSSVMFKKEDDYSISEQIWNTQLVINCFIFFIANQRSNAEIDIQITLCLVFSEVNGQMKKMNY